MYMYLLYSTCILYTASLSYLAFSGSIQGPFHYYFTDSVIVGILVTSINSRWVLYALSRLSFCLCHRPPRYHHCHYIFLIKDLLNNFLYRAADSVALVDWAVNARYLLPFIIFLKAQQSRPGVGLILLLAVDALNKYSYYYYYYYHYKLNVQISSLYSGKFHNCTIF